MFDINSGNESPESKAQEYISGITGLPERIFPYITVEFKGNRREFFSNPMEFPFRIGDFAVVRVEKGEDLGRVVHLLEQLPENSPAPEREVLRRATSKDLKIIEEYRSKEQEARVICKEKIVKHGLEMKLVDVEYQFDSRKLIFYFTADGRIDFRQLVKDLAATFRTRIELRQIGARDETKRFGGLGPCGRQLCCSVYLREFTPIGTQMAKDQNLPLSPSKISGCCNRLKCCLLHELETYREALKVLPRWDSRLETSKGIAFVEKVDIFNRTVYLRYASGDVVKVEEAQLESLLSGRYEPPSSTECAVRDESEEEILSDDVTETHGQTASPATIPAKPPHSQSKKHKPHIKGKESRSGKRKKYPRNKSRRNFDRRNRK